MTTLFLVNTKVKIIMVKYCNQRPINDEFKNNPMRVALTPRVMSFIFINLLKTQQE